MTLCESLVRTSTPRVESSFSSAAQQCTCATELINNVDTTTQWSSDICITVQSHLQSSHMYNSVTVVDHNQENAVKSAMHLQLQCSHMSSPITCTLQSQVCYFSHSYNAITCTIQSHLHCSCSYIVVTATMQSHVQSSHMYIAVAAIFQSQLQCSPVTSTLSLQMLNRACRPCKSHMACRLHFSCWVCCCQ